MNDLHHSLYEDLAADLHRPLAAPAAAIFDHHMHLGEVRATRVYHECALAYGLEHALGIATLDQSRLMRRAFGDFFLFCGWPAVRDVELTPTIVDKCIREIEAQREAGFVALKFKIVPDNEGRAPRVWLDNPTLKPLFTRAEELGFTVQAHIAQPDAWFRKFYFNGEAGQKEHYFHQVEYLLDAHPGLTYVGVHMGGHPEDLDYLQKLIDDYPHFHLDTSATKWTIRELSRQHDRAREFFISNADRILFGSDLVVHNGVSPTYYTSRFHVQRTMWETDFRGRSMIKDPDSEAAPVICGLDLPGEVLKNIYWGNAARILGLEGAGEAPASR